MASPTEELTKFAQSVYLVIKNRYYDGIAGEDGQLFIQQIADWVNMFADELENTVDPENRLVDWWFTRTNDFSLGTATAGSKLISLPSTVDRLITEDGRYVQVFQGSTLVSSFAVVQPKNISNLLGSGQEDRCALVGSNIVFSRAFRDSEANGSVLGDVSIKLPRIAFTINGTTVQATNVKMLSIVQPQLLLKLGVAKNSTLADIIKGKLSPSYSVKFDKLMTGAIARSLATSRAATATRQDYGHVRGIY